LPCRWRCPRELTACPGATLGSSALAITVALPDPFLVENGSSNTICDQEAFRRPLESTLFLPVGVGVREMEREE
jgi:hypothetical protein